MIEQVMSEIQSPFLYYYEYDSQLLTDRYYIAFSIGSNGYDYVFWESINYNAIIGFFVLDLLLQDVMKKLIPELEQMNLKWVV